MPKITRAGGPSFGTEPGDDIPAILADFGVTDAELVGDVNDDISDQPEPEPVPGF